MRKPGPTKNPESKRNDPNQTALTAYCSVKTRDRLQHCIHLAAIAGPPFPANQSDILEAALTSYLDALEPELRQKIANQLGDVDKTNSGEG